MLTVGMPLKTMGKQSRVSFSLGSLSVSYWRSNCPAIAKVRGARALSPSDTERARTGLGPDITHEMTGMVGCGQLSDEVFTCLKQPGKTHSGV